MTEEEYAKRIAELEEAGIKRPEPVFVEISDAEGVEFLVWLAFYVIMTMTIIFVFAR